MSTPHFTVRKKFFSEDCYVFVSFPSGEKRKIARFASALDAENWLRFRSHNWLERHRMELELTSATSQARA
jgi:hypothetical protein